MLITWMVLSRWVTAPHPFLVQSSKIKMLSNVSSLTWNSLLHDTVTHRSHRPPVCARALQYTVWYQIGRVFKAVASVNKWVYQFSKFGHLEKWKIAQNYKIFANVGSQFCQKLNGYWRNTQKPLIFLPKWWNFVKSGHTRFRQQYFLQK